MFSADSKPQVLLLALLAAVLALLVPSYAALHQLWTDAANHTYTHGYLMLGICAWLTWRALPRVLSHGIKPAFWLLAPLAVAVAAWAVALTAGLQDLHLLLLPVIVWLSLAVVFGPRAASELLLPIGFIVFALPLWSSGNFILQQITVWVNGFLIWMTGITAYMHGNFVQVPAGSFEIADGCSGLHFLIVGLAIAVLYGELGRDTLRRRLEWVLLAAVLSMLANWLRVFTIIMAGYLTDMQHYLVRVDHYKFGWVVFAGTLIVFFLIANRRAPAMAPASAARPGGSTSSLAGVPVASGAVLLTAAVFSLLAWRAASPAGNAAATLDWPSMGQATVVGSATSWTPVYPGASTTGMRGYELPSGVTLYVYQAVYTQQRQGAEMVGGSSSLFGEERMNVVSEGIVPGAGGAWQEWQTSSGNQSTLTRVRWEVGRRTFARPWASQLWYGVSRLFSPVSSRVVALRARCDGDCAATQAALDEAGKAFLPGVF